MTIALVQHTFAHFAGASGAQNVTFVSAVTTGNVIGAFVATNSQSSAAPTAVSDTNSDSLITALTWRTGAGEGAVGAYLFAVGSGGSSFKITVNFAAGTTYTVIIFEYSGVNASSPLDGSAAYNSGASGTTASTGSLTPSQAGDQQIAFLNISNTNSVSAWGNSLVQEQVSSSSNAPLAYLADLNLAGVSAVSSSATITTGPWNMAQILLAPTLSISSQARNASIISPSVACPF